MRDYPHGYVPVTIYEQCRHGISTHRGDGIGHRPSVEAFDGYFTEFRLVVSEEEAAQLAYLATVNGCAPALFNDGLSKAVISVVRQLRSLQRVPTHP